MVQWRRVPDDRVIDVAHPRLDWIVYIAKTRFDWIVGAQTRLGGRITGPQANLECIHTHSRLHGIVNFSEPEPTVRQDSP